MYLGRNRRVLVVYTVSMQSCSFCTRFYIEIGWDCGFFIGERIRGEVGNDMCVWKRSN